MTDRFFRNRVHNASNPNQGDAKRVLCVCSAGLLRSPTAAKVLSEEFGFNTRAVGCVKDFALVPLDPVLLYWADEVVCMDNNHASAVFQLMKNEGIINQDVVVLDIPDQFEYNQPELVEMIKERYEDS